jgi:hypothetical protein
LYVPGFMLLQWPHQGAKNFINTVLPGVFEKVEEQWPHRVHIVRRSSENERKKEYYIVPGEGILDMTRTSCF